MFTSFIYYALLVLYVGNIHTSSAKKVFSRCSRSKYDIFIVMDGSKYIQEQQFNSIKTFLQQFVQRVDIGLGKTHVGLLLANDNKRHTRLEISLGQYNSSEALSDAIGGVKQRGRRRPNMAHALEMVQNKVFTGQDGDRRGVRDVLILFTSEIHTTKLENVLKRAAELKAKNVEIITVPVESGKMSWSFKDQLNAVASIPQNVIMIQPHRLKRLQKALKRRICNSRRALHPGRGCSRKDHDVFFVLDGSGSISSDYFRKTKDFLIKLIENLDVGPRGTHVGLIQFSHKLKTRIEFKLGQLLTLKEIRAAILRMAYQGGGTETGDALEIVNEKVFPADHLYRPNVRDVVVVITDGEARDRLKALNESEKLRSKGVQVIAIGIGEQDTVASFRQDLQLMASEPSDVYTADFNNLPFLIKTLTSEICHARPRRAIQCSHRQKDIMLVVDGSASVGIPNMKKVKAFLKKLVLELNIGKKRNHVGMIQFSEAMRTRSEFGFNEYYEVEMMTKAIDGMIYQMGLQTMTGYALAMVQRMVFTTRHGDRAEAGDVVILVADGGAHDKKEALENAAKLKARGVKILTVYIPENNDNSNGRELLKNIASSAKDAYTSNFDDLKYIAADLVKVVCSK